MIFNVKVKVNRKSILVIRGYVVDSSRHEEYAITTKSVSTRILMTIAAENNLNIMTGDIRKVYLNAYTKEKIYTREESNFELLGVMAKGTLLEVAEALYGLPTSSNRWHTHLLHTLR